MAWLFGILCGHRLPIDLDLGEDRESERDSERDEAHEVSFTLARLDCDPDRDPQSRRGSQHSPSRHTHVPEPDTPAHLDRSFLSRAVSFTSNVEHIRELQRYAFGNGHGPKRGREPGEQKGASGAMSRQETPASFVCVDAATQTPRASGSPGSKGLRNVVCVRHHTLPPTYEQQELEEREREQEQEQEQINCRSGARRGSKAETDLQVNDESSDAGELC